MKYIVFLLSIVLMASCAQQNENASEAENTEESVEAPSSAWAHYGDTINNENILSADEMMVIVSESGEAEVKMEGMIEEACQKKGCWMKVNVAGIEDPIMVKFKDYGFFVPLNSAGNSVVMEGVISYDTTNVDDLKHYAEDAGKSQEEIDAITEPEINLAFEAHGVMIKEEAEG